MNDMKYLDLAKAALKRHSPTRSGYETNELRSHNERGKPEAHERTADHEKNEVNEVSCGASCAPSKSIDDHIELPELIGWFQAARHVLPRFPFMLRPGCRVIDSERFYGALESDITKGASGVRWKAGLHGDLADLRAEWRYTGRYHRPQR
jgi:hypothetical protein